MSSLFWKLILSLGFELSVGKSLNPRPSKCLPKLLPFECAVQKVYSHKPGVASTFSSGLLCRLGYRLKRISSNTDCLASVWLAETLMRLACFAECFLFNS